MSKSVGFFQAEITVRSRRWIYVHVYQYVNLVAILKHGINWNVVDQTRGTQQTTVVCPPIQIVLLIGPT